MSPGTSRQESEPTREELLAMAYADGELDEAARREFETLLESRADLLLEVSQLRRLQVLARQVVAPEPMDFEWRALARDPLQRSGLTLGWVLLSAGALGVASWAAWLLFSSELELVPKLLIGALLAGFVLLLLMTLRARLRTLPHDPYTEIRR